MQGEAQTAAKAAGQSTAENTAAAALQHTPQRPLEALCAIARFHQVAADPANLRHQLGLQPSDEIGAEELLRAAKQLGLKAKRSVTPPNALH